MLRQYKSCDRACKISLIAGFKLALQPLQKYVNILLCQRIILTMLNLQLNKTQWALMFVFMNSNIRTTW